MSDGGNEGGEGRDQTRRGDETSTRTIGYRGGGGVLRYGGNFRRGGWNSVRQYAGDGREGWLRSKDLKTRTMTPGELRGRVGVRLEGRWRIVGGFAEERKGGGLAVLGLASRRSSLWTSRGLFGGWEVENNPRRIVW